MQLRWKKLIPEATIPSRGSAEAAGWDLFPVTTITMKPGDTVVIGTGIASQFSPGWVGLVMDRSGLGFKDIVRRAGVIDSDYRGEWKVRLVNQGEHMVVLTPNKACAQVIFVPCFIGDATEVKELDSSDRGEKGFSSTDTKEV